MSLSGPPAAATGPEARPAAEPGGRPRRNIILCSDGTGNSAIKGRGTNVWKLYEALDLNGHLADPSLTPQVAFYDDGVGTQQLRLVKAASGALGWGLSRNVKQLYLELCRSWAPGDRIFLFGFSRGAFTVRTLAGLITECGIIDVSRISESRLLGLVDDAYESFRRHFRTWQGEKIARYRNTLGRSFGGVLGALQAQKADQRTAEFRKKHAVMHGEHCPDGRPRIRFVGVWDTVDAVGLPVDELADWLNQYFYPFRFPDFRLSEKVDKGCHAIAIDDERHSFHPVMWDESREDKAAGRIEQVWFAGVHSNVGGGYPKQGMSLVPLAWMVERARDQGLRFIEHAVRHHFDARNVNDRLYDSRSGLAAYYRYKPRNIQGICAKNGVVPEIHESVLHRLDQRTEGYSPGNLPARFRIARTASRSGPPETRAEELWSAPAGTAPADGPLHLDKLRRAVTLRRAFHLVQVLASVALVVTALTVPVSLDPVTRPADRALETITSYVPVIGPQLHGLLVTRPGLGAGLIGLILISHLAGRFVRRRMGLRLQDSWQQILRRREGSGQG